MIGAVLWVAALAQAPAVTPEQPARVTQETAREISLHEAVQLAIGHNLEVEIERANVAEADAALAGAKGFTDFDLRYQPGYQARSVPAPSLLEASNGKLSEHYDTQNVSLHEQSGWNGLGFDAAFENSRVSSGDPFLGINPFYTTQITLNFTQPLWRNRAIDQNRATVLIRAKSSQLSRTAFEMRAIDVVTRVEQAYWDLEAARRNLEVEGEAVELAQTQLERDRRRIRVGTLASAEEAAAQSELSRREDVWYASAAVVARQENALKTLLAPATTADVWNQELIPSDHQAIHLAEVTNVAAAIAEALRSRPELRDNDLRLAIAEVERKQNDNLTKPQVNLNATYILQGLAGKQNLVPDPITQATDPLIAELNGFLVPFGQPAVSPFSLGSLPAALYGGYGTALGTLFEGRYQTVSFGLQVDLTLRNRAAKAAVEQSVIAERRERLQRAQIEQAIDGEVRDAAEELAIAKQRRIAAEAGERAAREKLESETRLFENGESTNFLTLTRQNEYSDARRRALISVLEYNKAVAQFDRAVGATLKRNQIALR